MKPVIYLVIISIVAVLLLVFLFVRCSHMKLEDLQQENQVDSLTDSTMMQDAGFDGRIWEGVNKDIIDGNFGKIHGIAVIYKQQPIIETYYNQWPREKLHDIQSVTKSVTSALIGIAIDKGFIKSLDEKLIDFYPDFQFSNSSSLRESIRIRDLLTMSAGAEWNEQSIKYKEKGNSLTDMYAQSNAWIPYILNMPVIEKPGTKFNYNSGVTMVLGDILKRSTGMEVEEFAKQYLFAPLGIDEFEWSKYNGVTHCGGGLSLKMSDMLKIGLVYYHEGRYNNQQVISKEWVQESLKPRLKAGDKLYYGYQWFVIDSVFSLKPLPYAAGNGWQFLFLSKEFDLVIATTGGNYGEEKPKTTMSQNELLYAILTCVPAYRKKIDELYERHPDPETLNAYEVLVIAHTLNRQAEYSKSARFLEKIIGRYKDNLIVNYLLAEAYVHLGEKEKASVLLNRCQKMCNRKSVPKAGYCQMSSALLKQL